MTTSNQRPRRAPATPKAAPAVSPTPGVRYFRNTSPQGALELPLVRAVVPRGGLVAVPAARAARIERQAVWTEVDATDALTELAAIADAQPEAAPIIARRLEHAASEAAAAAALAAASDTADETNTDPTSDPSADATNTSTDNQGDQS